MRAGHLPGFGIDGRHRFAHSVDIPGDAHPVIRQCHRRATDDIQIGFESAGIKSTGKLAEQGDNALAIKEHTHVETSIWRPIITPRARKADGQSLSVSARRDSTSLAAPTHHV